MTNHQQQKGKNQEVLFTMEKTYKNPNILPLSYSQDFEISHHQHSANETHEKEGIITKNENYEEVKKLKNPDNQQLNTSHTLKGNISASKTLLCPSDISHTLKNGPTDKPASCSHLILGEEEEKDTLPPSSPQEVPMVEESGRDRLKRHRESMAGRVWIPDIWGHEDLLKDWIDCTVFDSSLGNKTIMSARAALVQEGRSTRRIHNQC